MFDRSLVDPDNPELMAAQEAAGVELSQGVGTLDDPRATEDPQAAALAAWSLVHGFSLLWLNRAIKGAIAVEGDPVTTVHRVQACSSRAGNVRA